jgi:hypothetical protein
MARGRQTLRRIHIWLGWIIGLPILLWVVSGLVMVIRPIEEVRGEGLIGEAPPIRLTAPLVPPQIGPRPVASVSLEQRSRGPVWIIRYTDGASRLADPGSGRLLPELSAADAAEVVRSRYTGEAQIASISRTSAENPPLELRRKVDSWRVALDDGTRFYVNAETGEIAARRTGWWRIYDFMWGLHIMDPATRENTNNPFVIFFGFIALVTTLLALVLLPMTIRRRGRSE